MPPARVCTPGQRCRFAARAWCRVRWPRARRISAGASAADDLEVLLRLAELGAVALEQARMREELEQAVEAGVEAMAAAVDMRDDYTGAHSDEVVRLARTVGERMGLAQDQLGELEFAARLHDVGKIGVPDAVLRKDGPLEGGEWEIMRQHPAWGADMLCRIPGLKRHLANRAARTRALGRRRLSGPAAPGGHPAREPHHLRVRRLQRDDLGPARTATRCVRGSPSASCARVPAGSSTRMSSTRS